MSEGPLKQWRDSFKPPRVSTTDAARVCGANRFGVAYCGRRHNSGIATNWANVTCADCIAARRADEAGEL